MNVTYQLTYNGEILPGHDPQRVRSQVSAALKITPEQAEAIFAGRRVVLRKGLPEAEVARYVRHFEAMGARVHAESLPVAPAAPVAAVAAAPASPQVSTPPALALAEPVEEIVCPKCGERQQFIYDAANRLVEVKDKDGATVATYQYDPFGRRIAKTVADNTTFFLYGDEGLIAEATPTGSITTEYGWQPGNLWGTDPLFIKTTKTNGQSPEVFFYQNDHLGTPQKVIDAQGNIVWEMKALAFGETSVAPTSAITNPFRFPGQYEDVETQTYYNFFRTYDFATGRYVQSDPIGLFGGSNSFEYVNGNPLRGFDSLGLIEWSGQYHTRSLVEVLGATQTTYTLTSDCINGQRARITVIFVGSGVGAGIPRVPIFATESYGDISFHDNQNGINPTVFEGLAGDVGIGVVIGSWGPSFNKTRLGKAFSNGSGGSQSSGINVGATAMFGSSTVTSAIYEDCSCE